MSWICKKCGWRNVFWKNRCSSCNASVEKPS